MDDVVQGELGDGGLLKALTLVGSSGPETIDNLFVQEHCMPEKGLYTLKFFKDGEWTMVLIDDKIPCRIGTQTPIFARSRTDHEAPILHITNCTHKSISIAHTCTSLTA